MPGMPVSIGCALMITPGAAGPPDSGVIVSVLQTVAVANGQPLAVQGSLCQFVNSVTGVPYVLSIGAPISPGIMVNNMPVIRMGDVCPTPPGTIQVLGPPVAPFINDGSG